MPLAAIRLLAMNHVQAAARKESVRFDSLENDGFKTERYGDVLHQMYDRAGTT